MSIFDIFSPKGGANGGQATTTNPAPANNPGNPAQQQQLDASNANKQQSSAEANPTIPNNSNTPVVLDANGNATKSPLDDYSKIWDTTEIKTPEPLFNVDPTKMRESASRLDFTKVITPELQTRINAGGTDALAASMEAMNKMSQATYAESALATTSIVTAAVEKTKQEFLAALPDIIKGQSANELLRNTNPVFENPAIAPVLQSLEARIRAKNPTMSATTIADTAKQYFLDMSATVQDALNPPKAGLDATGRPARKETDWSEYL